MQAYVFFRTAYTASSPSRLKNNNLYADGASRVKSEYSIASSCVEQTKIVLVSCLYKTKNDLFSYVDATSKVCQLLSWWMKGSLHSFNACHIVSDVVPFCLVCQVPSYKPSFIILALI